MASVSLADDIPSAYTFKHLQPNSWYRVELRANNELGFSDTESIVFKTAETGMKR